jgi:NADH oxidase (H2O2-forming)
LLHTQEGRIVGGQIIGTSGVLARINMLSFAMQRGAGLADIAAMETAYTPPLSPTVDPLTLAAELALRKSSRRRNRQ